MNQDMNFNNNDYNNYNQFQTPNDVPQKNNQSKGAIIVIIVAALIIIIAGAFIFFKNRPTEDIQDNDQTNSNPKTSDTNNLIPAGVDFKKINKGHIHLK